MYLLVLKVMWETQCKYLKNEERGGQDWGARKSVEGLVGLGRVGRIGEECGSVESG